MNGIFLGVRGWIWLYFGFSILGFLGAIIYWYREEIKKRYYTFRYPEKLLRVVIHYIGGTFREYWRIIPDDKIFIVEGKIYKFTDRVIIKSDNEIFATKKNGKILLKIDGKTYNLDREYSIHKRKDNRFPEIHYYFNNPNPLSFVVEKGENTLSAFQETEFRNNNLVSQLLTMDSQKNVMNIVIILLVILVIAVLFIIAKEQGLIQ